MNLTQLRLSAASRLGLEIETGNENQTLADAWANEGQLRAVDELKLPVEDQVINLLAANLGEDPWPAGVMHITSLRVPGLDDDLEQVSLADIEKERRAWTEQTTALGYVAPEVVYLPEVYALDEHKIRTSPPVLLDTAVVAAVVVEPTPMTDGAHSPGLPARLHYLVELYMLGQLADKANSGFQQGGVTYLEQFWTGIQSEKEKQRLKQEARGQLRPRRTRVRRDVRVGHYPRRIWPGNDLY